MQLLIFHQFALKVTKQNECFIDTWQFSGHYLETEELFTVNRLLKIYFLQRKFDSTRDRITFDFYLHKIEFIRGKSR